MPLAPWATLPWFRRLFGSFVVDLCLQISLRAAANPQTPRACLPAAGAASYSGMNEPKIHCEGCGACCTRVGYPPFTDQDQADFAALEQQHPELVATIHLAATENRRSRGMPCVWLDSETKRCQHYDLRPKICRAFELGSPKCLELRWLKGIS